MSNSTNKAACIKITNSLSPEARDCATQIFKTNSTDVNKESNEKLLLGSMSYTTSACYYAGKTPLEAQVESEAESEAKLGEKPSNESQNLKPMGIPEFTTSGTSLTHLNKYKLKDYVTKVLKIKLVSISNVVDKDSFGWAMQNSASDPFVVFTAGISMSTSTVKTNQANAEWNTEHFLLVREKTIFDEGVPTLRVHVLDCDSTKIDPESSSLYELRKHSDLLGSKSFDIRRELEKKGSHELSIIFDTKEKKTDDRMKLNLEYELISVDEYCEIRKRTDPKQWFDEDPLKNSKQDARKVLANTDFVDVKIRPLLYFDNKHTNTQGLIHASNEDHVAIVAFRGASVMDKQDYLTEKDAHFASLEGMDINDYVLKPKEALANHEGKKVHGAFRDAYNSVRESLLETIYSATAWLDVWQVVFTGTSFGGAIAALGAYEFANRKLNNKGVKVAMMSYGSPRLANPAFVESYKESVLVSYRFRYNKDPICCFPQNMEHVPALVTCDPDGSVKFGFPGPEPPKGTISIPKNEDDEDKEYAAKLTIHEAVTIHVTYEFTYTIDVSRTVISGAK